MKELANEVQMVIDALNGGLEMPSTYKNCATLAICIEKLLKVRDSLSKDEIEIEVGDDNGNSDSK